MVQYFDRLETRSADERESALQSALPALVAHAKAKSPYFARLLASVDPRDIASRHALAALPVTRKSQLLERQEGHEGQFSHCSVHALLPRPARAVCATSTPS